MKHGLLEANKRNKVINFESESALYLNPISDSSLLCNLRWMPWTLLNLSPLYEMGNIYFILELEKLIQCM